MTSYIIVSDSADINYGFIENYTEVSDFAVQRTAPCCLALRCGLL